MIRDHGAAKRPALAPRDGRRVRGFAPAAAAAALILAAAMTGAGCRSDLRVGSGGADAGSTRPDGPAGGGTGGAARADAGGAEIPGPDDGGPGADGRRLSFLVGNSYASGLPRVGVTAVVAADFDGDGRPDLAVANGRFGSRGDVGVLLNAGGAFAAPIRYAAGENPRALAAGDFDGDGRPDLAVANLGDGTLSVLRNSGGGTFAPAVAYEVGVGPTAVAVGDLDGDGRLDLAVSSMGLHTPARPVAGTVSVLRNRGGGTFAPGGTHAVGAGPVAIAVADLDGDGRLDLALAGRPTPGTTTLAAATGTLSLLLNAGGGTFTAVREHILGIGSLLAVMAGDLDGDGRPDLVLGGSGYGTPSASVLRNITGAAGVGFATVVTYSAGYSSGSFALADVDGDGALDLAIGAENGGGFFLLAGRGDGSFAAPTASGVMLGLEIAGLALGDFDADGAVDLALANRSGGVGIAANDGNGRFGPLALHQMHGGGPRAVAFGDFDGDGRQDIAVACATDLRQDGVSVLSGRPDGGFALPVRYATGTRPRAMAAGDLDGDGRPDLAVANFDSADLSVLRGRPDGSFAPAVRHAAGGGPVAVAIGDLDGDGRPDLAVANNLHLDSVSGGATGNVAVLRNTGDGDLGAAALYAVGRNPSAVAIGDLDGDGRPDLAVVNNGSRNGALEVDDAGSVSVLRGDGRGGFATPVHYPAGVRPFAVAVGDLDGDGRADLAVTTTGARYEDRMVNVLLGQAGGAFAAPVSYLAGFGPRAIALADTGTDGALDLLVLNTGSADVSVLENDGAGHFSAAARYSVGEEPMAVAVGDLNGDGRADLGAVSSVAEDVTVLLGSAGGGYRGARSQATGGSRPTAIGIGDLDRDGTPDLVVLGDKSLTNGSQLAVLLGDGRGGTRTANVYAASDAGSWSPRALALGDLDGDGALDVATASYFGEGVNVALGKGDGTLGDGVHYATGNYTVGLAMGDLDGDGRADLAVANGRNEIGEVSVLRNEGGGTLGAPARLPMGAGTPSSVTLADVNGDGRADLIVPIRINDAAGTVNVLLNAGGGTFAAPASYLTGPSPRMVAAGDLDGDGKPDLAVTNTGNGGVSVLLNAGDGTFARPVGYAAGVQPETVALSDLNGDGSLDLAITGAWSNGVVALVNRGGGRFAPAVRFIAGAAPTALAAGDLDLDGKPDLAVSNGVSATGGGGVTVLLNTTPF